MFLAVPAISISMFLLYNMVGGGISGAVIFSIIFISIHFCVSMIDVKKVGFIWRSLIFFVSIFSAIMLIWLIFYFNIFNSSRLLLSIDGFIIIRNGFPTQEALTYFGYRLTACCILASIAGAVLQSLRRKPKQNDD